jgi:hypothetical protein
MYADHCKRRCGGKTSNLTSDCQFDILGYLMQQVDSRPTTVNSFHVPTFVNDSAESLI